MSETASFASLRLGLKMMRNINEKGKTMYRAKNSGPRCPTCGRYFEPRVMRDGNLSKTCGQTACVSAYQSRKSFSWDGQPRQPRKVTSLY